MFIVHCLSWFYLCNFNYTLFLICLLLGFFCFWEFIRSTDFWFLWWITTVMIIFGLAMVELLFIIWYIFVFFFLSYFCWGKLGSFFGCNVISYGQVLLWLWISLLMILAREVVVCWDYFSVSSILLLFILPLYCICGRISLLSF